MEIFSNYSLQIGGVLLFAVFIYYYFHILLPYKNLPSRRVEFEVLHWMLTKKSLNTILFQNLLKILKFHENDGICVIWFFKPYVFVFNEETTKSLMNDPDILDKPSEYKIIDFCLKNSMFTSNGEIWRRMRTLSSPGLQKPVVRDNIDIYNRYSTRLVEQLSLAEPQETTKYLKDSFISAFMESIYGLKADNPENKIKIKLIVETIERLSKFIVQRMMSPWLYWDFALHIFPSARKNLKIYNEVMHLSKEILNQFKENTLERRIHEPDNHPRPKSVAEVFIDQHIKNPSFTLNDALYQINALLTANASGMPLSMLWCLFLLGHHPDIQEKAFEEVTSETGEDVTFQELRNLKYLECIIKESFRLYPTIPMFARQLPKKYSSGKYKIPENSTIVFLSYIIHRLPNVYPDPEKFDPNRFMESSSKINEGNYVPFAEGIRSCLGKNFTMMGMKVFLCHIIRNFKIISLDRREDVTLSFEILLAPSKDLDIKFVRRTTFRRNDNEIP